MALGLALGRWGPALWEEMTPEPGERAQRRQGQREEMTSPGVGLG